MMSSPSEDERSQRRREVAWNRLRRGLSRQGRGGSCGQGNLLLHDQEREPAQVQVVRDVGGDRLPSGEAKAAPIAAGSSNQSSATAS